MQKESHHFQAEIQQLLDIVIHSLYTDKEIFVRELISNAADACEKLRFQQSSGQPVYQPDIAPGISVVTDDKAATITITDTGCGMTPEVQAHLRGVLARHYEQWVDEQLPALKGKTPREAVRTKAGREAWTWWGPGVERPFSPMARDGADGKALRRFLF